MGTSWKNISVANMDLKKTMLFEGLCTISFLIFGYIIVILYFTKMRIENDKTSIKKHLQKLGY